MPRLRAAKRTPAVTEVVPQRPPHGFQKGHKQFGGRQRGQQNITSARVREAIILGLEAAGDGNMADYVTKVALADHRLGVAMMSLVCPKAIDATVRHEPVLVTVEDLDRSLIASGLPPTRQVFGIDFRGSDTVEDDTEAMAVEAEITTKKERKMAHFCARRRNQCPPKAIDIIVFLAIYQANPRPNTRASAISAGKLLAIEAFSQLCEIDCHNQFSWGWINQGL